MNNKQVAPSVGSPIKTVRVTAMREKGWHRNGETFKVGNFQLDAVNAQGVVAGCHTILWDEIERFARTQGWVQ